MGTDIITINDSDISRAWGRAFIEVMTQGNNLPPMCVSISDFDADGPTEIQELRENLDCLLAKNDKTYSCKISGEMIFPFTWWNREKPDRQSLYKWYLEKYLPRYRASTHRASKETYFERLIAYRGHENDDNGILRIKAVNQLEHILEAWQKARDKSKWPRRSALQASCFDPSRDHTFAPYLPFPCLQQIGLSFSKERMSLAITGYYTTQYIIDRAYGNYLGLLNLGRFMAQEMGLALNRVSCITANPRLSGNKLKKSSLRPLESVIQRYL